MFNLEGDYQVDYQNLFTESFDLSMSMQEMAAKIGKLATILEERALMIENESNN